MKKFNYNSIKIFKKQTNYLQSIKLDSIKNKIKKSSKKIIIRFLKLKNKYIKKFYYIYIKHNKKCIISLKTINKYKIENSNISSSRFKIFRKQFFFFKKFASINNTFLSYNLFSNLYNKFLSFIFKVGKKNIWNNNFSNIFDLLSLKLHYSKSILLLKIFTRLFTRVEVKKVKSRKRVTYIPFFIKLPRSIFLSLKWIFLSTLKKKGNISFKNKLFNELLQILTQKSCFSLQKVEENNTSAFKNRSNIHYRWQKTR